MAKNNKYIIAATAITVGVAAAAGAAMLVSFNRKKKHIEERSIEFEALNDEMDDIEEKIDNLEKEIIEKAKCHSDEAKKLSAERTELVNEFNDNVDKLNEMQTEINEDAKCAIEEFTNDMEALASGLSIAADVLDITNIACLVITGGNPLPSLGLLAINAVFRDPVMYLVNELISKSREQKKEAIDEAE